MPFFENPLSGASSSSSSSAARKSTFGIVKRERGVDDERQEPAPRRVGLFAELNQVVLELGRMDMKAKKTYTNLLRQHGADLSFVVARGRTSLVVTTGEEWARQRSSKLAQAMRLSIPVVDISYVVKSIEAQKLLPTFLFAPQAPPSAEDHIRFGSEAPEVPLSASSLSLLNSLFFAC